MATENTTSTRIFLKVPLLIALFAIFFLQNEFVSAQSLTNEQARKDLIQLKKAIEIYNPGLGKYNDNFSKANELIAMIDTDSLSLITYFSYVSQLCALCKEGHFSLGDWSDAVHAGFLSNSYMYLPLSVKVSDGKLFAWIDNSREQLLKRGDEILEIDGRKISDIIAEIYKAYPSDGMITTYIDRNIELGFSWMYYFYLAQPSQFHIKVKDLDQNIKEVKIEALTRDEQFSNYEKLYPERNNSNSDEDTFYNLYHEEETCWLTLPSFNYGKAKENNIKSKRLYKSIFSELKEHNTKYLVVDLRGNTGGRNEFADDIVPFILKGSANDPFLKKTISWEGKQKVYNFPKSSKLNFSGDVYVLVDGRTYSAGNTLARYLKEYADATIIGEETGTRYEGFVAGSKQYVTLTNSQIKIGIPRYHIIFPESKKQSTQNRGLLPDYTVQYSIEDYSEKKDLHMEKAKSLINQN